MTKERLNLLRIEPGNLKYEAGSGEVGFAGESLQCVLPNEFIPAPTSVKWEGKVMTNSETNAKGDLFIEYVGKKRQVTVEWSFLTHKQYYRLLQALGIDFNQKDQPFIYYKIRAFDPSNADYGYIDDEGDTGKEMITYLEGKYVGSVTVFHTPYESDDGESSDLTVGYSDVSLVFIER